MKSENGVRKLLFKHEENKNAFKSEGLNENY